MYNSNVTVDPLACAATSTQIRLHATQGGVDGSEADENLKDNSEGTFICVYICMHDSGPKIESVKPSSTSLAPVARTGQATRRALLLGC